jgi:dTMP kinase
MAGTFITFEGIDGSGKSTQLRLLGNFLRDNGCDALLTREPGGTTLGLRLRAVLLDALEEVDPLTELLVFAADRAQHVRSMLKPELANGRVVISDRYADATVAYQGAGRGFSPELISQIVELATAGLKPDLTLLFDVSIEESANRTTRRSTKGSASKAPPDRLDIEHADFHTRVRQGRAVLRQVDGWLDETVEQVRAIRQTTRKGRRVIEEVREALVDLERALDDAAEPSSEPRHGDGPGSARVADAARH